MNGAPDTAVSTALTLMMARIAGGPSPALPDGRVRVRDIIDTVAWWSGVPASDIIGPNRRWSYFRPRAAVCWLAIKIGGASTTTIGRVLGDRDHSTIIHAKRRADALRLIDPAFRRLTDRLLDHFRDLQED
ncbi:dnaA protein helix-turn-helix [Sphingobium faniae]|nr:dnaA protein helix-turn-helix [Sphingobium faniae]